MGQVDNMPALGQIMAWYRPGDKPLYETIMARLQRHIGATRPQCVGQAQLVYQPCSQHLMSRSVLFTLQRLARVLKWLMM